MNNPSLNTPEDKPAIEEFRRAFAGFLQEFSYKAVQQCWAFIFRFGLEDSVQEEYMRGVKGLTILDVPWPFPLADNPRTFRETAKLMELESHQVAHQYFRTMLSWVIRWAKRNSDLVERAGVDLDFLE